MHKVMERGGSRFAEATKKKAVFIENRGSGQKASRSYISKAQGKIRIKRKGGKGIRERGNCQTRGGLGFGDLRDPGCSKNIWGGYCWGDQIKKWGGKEEQEKTVFLGRRV